MSDYCTRRDFIKRVGLTAGMLSASSIISRNVLADKKELPIFTFVQLTDTHLHVPENLAYIKVHEKLKHVVEIINAEKAFPMPDFVIHTGDIIHGGKLEYLLPECKMARDILSELKCPYYPLLGNHENMAREGDPVYQGPYEQVFGKDRVNYHFIYKGILFVCLNTSNTRGANNKVTQQRNQWLKEVLQKYPQMPKVVACHVPLVPLRDESVLKESFFYPSYKLVGDDTWDIVRSEKEKIIAVICGHLHLTGVVEKEGIYHICPSGLASYPCHYARYAVYKDRIEVKILQVKSDLVTSRTNLHGKPRYSHGFTDSLHKTPDEYVSGASFERNFVIQLPESKQPVVKLF